jgi:hypothetical protein
LSHVGEDDAVIPLPTGAATEYDSFVAEGRLAVQPYLNFSYLPESVEPYFRNLSEDSAMFPAATGDDDMEVLRQEQSADDLDHG